MNNNNNTLVSVIIPVFNAEKTLRDCLNSLMEQNYPRDNFEIIAIDNMSEDSSLSILLEYDITVLQEKVTQSSYAARNKGILGSKGEILTFIDTDCIADKNWITNFVELFDNMRVDGAAGCIKSYKSTTLVEKYQEERNILSQETLTKTPLGSFPVTANACYRKSVFNKIGLFDERLISGGDYEFAKRANSAGTLRIVYYEKAVVFHKHRSNLRAMWKQQFRYGYGVKQVMQQHTDLKSFHRIEDPYIYMFLGVFYYALIWMRNLVSVVFRRRKSASLIAPFLDYLSECAFRFGFKKAPLLDNYEKKLRVAYLVTEFPSVSQTFILDQITYLIDHGYDVHIYAKYPHRGDEKHPQVDQYRLLDKTRYYCEGQLHNKTFDSFWKDILFNIKKNPKGTIGLVLQTISKQRIVSLRETLRLSALMLERGPYDIVHCHFGVNGLIGSHLKTNNVIQGQLITAFHGYDMSRYIQQNGNHVYDRLFKIGDIFLPVCEYWRNKLISLGCPEKKIVVHRVGVDVDNIKYIKRSSGSRIKFLSIARLVEKKGLKYAIIAVKRAVETFGDHIEYNIIGDGEKKKEFSELVKSQGLEHIVKLQGWKTRGAVKALLENSDIFLLPSCTADDGDMEGIPVSLMEAMASGMPVISTRHSGIPELIEESVSGLLVQEKNSDQLTGCIVELINNPQIWGAMGHAGRKFIEENHNNILINNKLEKIYKELIN